MTFLLLAWPYDEDAGAVLRLAFSDHAHVTRPGEMLGGVAIGDHAFERRVEAPLTLTRSIYSGTSIGGYSAAAAGAIRLANGDGGLDWLDRLAWDGRRLELWHVLPAGRLDQAVRLFAGLAERVLVGDEVEIEICDPARLLDQPFGLSRYAGTGGVEGGAELAERYRPITIGHCRKVEPVLIDAARRIYQVNDGPVAAISGAWDRGDPFEVIGADIVAADRNAAYAALAAADMAGLDMLTSLGHGLVRLAAKPEGRFQVDVTGMMVDGVTLTRFADVAVWAVTAMTDLGAEDIATGAQGAMAFLCPQSLAIHVSGSGPETVRAVLDQLADSIGAHFGFDQHRRFDFGLFGLADGSDPDFTLTDLDVVSITPRAVGHRLWRQEVGWGRLWSLMDEGDFAGAVDEGDQAGFTAEWQVEKAEDDLIKTASPLAEEDRLDSLLTDQGDAAAEAARRLALWRQRLRAFDLVVDLDPVRSDLTGCRAGVAIRLQDARFRLADGQNFRVIESRHDFTSGELHLAVLGVCHG